MSHVDGYTHANVIQQRVPQSLQGTVDPSIKKLNEFGVKVGPPNVGNQPKVKDAAADTIEKNLKTAFGSADAKASGIADKISVGAFGGGAHAKFEKRLGSLSQNETASLKKQLHFNGFKALLSKTSAEDRLAIRSGLVLAFAHGASEDEVAQFKSLLTNANPAMRNHVLEALNHPNAEPGRILQRFETTTTKYPDDAGQILYDLTKDADIGNEKVALEKSDKFVDNNMEKLGCKKGSKEEANLAIGAFAVSAYTSDLYKKANNELRAEAQNGTPPSKETQLLKQAAMDFMAKLPDFHGIVSRGGGSGWQDAAKQIYVPGAKVKDPTFLSCSPNRGFDGSIQFIIESRHGKEVSDLSVNGHGDGREVIFPPGTEFEVVSAGFATGDTFGNPNGDKVFLGFGADGKEKWEQVMLIVLREAD
jgi:hypothetical protein